MTIEATLNQLKQEIKAFNTELVASLSDTVNHVTSVEDADLLGDAAADIILNALIGKVTEHTDKVGVNIHGTTPADLGTYTRGEFDGILGSLLDRNSDAPLSFYGDREYLPPSVTGSFESGVNWAPWGYVGMLLEDNGTLMMLRTGTDGSHAGVYYSYLRDALNASDLSKSVMTNARYRPAYFPDNLEAMAVLYNNKDILIGMMMDKTTGARAGYFVSLINNTFDQTKHTGIIIPEGNILNVGNVGNLTITGAPIGYVKNDKVYILARLDSSGYMLGWRVWSINKTDLVNGVYNGATRESGWTINRGAKGSFAYGDIILSEVVTDLAAGANTNIDVTFTQLSVPNEYIHVDSAGRVKMMASAQIQVTDKTNAIQLLRQHLILSFEIPDNRIIDLSSYYAEKVIYDFNADHSGWSWNIPKQLGNWRNGRNGSPFALFDGDNSQRMFISDNNVVFTYWTWIVKTDRYIARTKYSEAADFLDIAVANTTPLSLSVGGYESIYASPVSTQMRYIANLGDSVLGAANKNWNSAGQLVQDLFYRVGYDPQFNYQYKSITKYNVLGFAPTADRKPLDDLPGNVKTTVRMVNESDPTGWLVHEARYENFYEKSTQGFASIDSGFNGSGSVSILPGVIDSLRNAIISRFSAAGINLTAKTGVLTLWYEVIVPQRYTDLPPFVIGHFISNDSTTRFFVASLNITGTRDAITGLSLVAASFGQWIVPSTQGITMNLGQGQGGAGQIAIRKVTGGYVVGIATRDMVLTVGDTAASISLLKYINSAWSINGTPAVDHYYSTPVNFANFPTLGLYLAAASENGDGHLLDAGTKLVGTLVCTDTAPTATMATFMANIDDPTKVKILLSQESVNAWMVYFADPTPAMVDGRYYELPIYTHQLDPVNDQNKRFYCWIVRRSGVETLEYYIDVSPNPPTGVDGSLYIGYFDTDANGLTTIDIKKRTALAGMLLSTEAAGQAIPVTSGVPNVSGRLGWR